ncbi:MAG: 1-acyl-sn-glycerol-3-phosphate acyltransferase [Mycoplasmoidaceae bacterium]|nr:1-acyl-sn-glycerol-3-phosphate acyltransferase [Mycoplasmoidaceae bacterium]
MSFVATKDIYVNKLAEGFFKAVGAIRIDKENISLDTFKQAKEKLDRGHAVAVFPEGSVQKT